jgi:integrase
MTETNREEQVPMTETTGHLRLIERKSGPIYYAAIRTADGQRLQRKLGPAWTKRSRPPAGHLTESMAEIELAGEIAKLDREEKLRTSQEVPTFAEAAEEWYRWIRDDRKRKPSTVRGYRNELDRTLLPKFGDLPLTEITVEMVDAYREELVAEDRLAPRTINKKLTNLHSIFARARKAYGISHNPAADADRQPEPNTGDLRVLDARGIEELIAAADNLQDAVLYRLATSTGMRLGELRALRWSDIDWMAQSIMIRRSYSYSVETAPKSGKVRSVPLTDQAAAALDDLSKRGDFTQPDDLVFISVTGHYLDDSKLRKRFHQALRRAGLPRIRLHDLRHTFGTIAAQAFPISDVKAMMGHASIQTTEIYVHYAPKHDAAERLTRLMRTNSDETRRTLDAQTSACDKSQPPETHSDSGDTEWAGKDSNLRPTDYESQTDT